MQVPHEHGKNCIVRKAFEDLADVRDPEGPFETGANLLQAFGEGQWLLLPDFMWRGRPRPRLPRNQYQSPSRSRICSAVRPATRITLFRLLWPAAIVTEERGTFKSSAKNSMQAWLALPSTGGAVRATFNAPPTSPVTPFFFARGCTLTAKVTPAGEFLIATITKRHHRGTQESPQLL